MYLIVFGMQVTQYIGHAKIQLEFENLHLIHALSCKTKDESCFSFLVEDIRELGIHFTLCNFAYISKEINKMIHCLARLVKTI